MSSPPIGPYQMKTAEIVPWQPGALEVAQAVADLVHARWPDLPVEHIGSTAVRGLSGKGIVDLAVLVEPHDVPALTALLTELGFGPQPGPDPFPATRPMLVGSMERGGIVFRIHCHVVPDPVDFHRLVAFRDALRESTELTHDYAALKDQIVEGGMLDGHQYTYQKQAWIGTVHRRLGVERPPIVPPATIGIIGGGQLGRMLALAARAMGYRIAILDPDPHCPTAAVADHHVVAGYDDAGAALRLAEQSRIVTYELEHVAKPVIDAIEPYVPVRPGKMALIVTQDRIAERRFVESIGAAVAPWRAVKSSDELRDAVAALGLPIRLKVASGGYDGRGQVCLDHEAEAERAFATLGRPPGEKLLAERHLDFDAELSITITRTEGGRMAAFPPARNVHDAGILVESVAPAPVPADVAERALGLGERLAVAMGLIGTLTAELFLLADGELVVNELAPRVHNSGHWTIEGAATSQFEQHIRAICGLELGATDALAPSAMVNLLGTGRSREAVPEAAGVARLAAEPRAHLHLYDKRRVFERRKMGHVTALGETTDDALDRARKAAAAWRWLDDSAEAE